MVRGKHLGDLEAMVLAAVVRVGRDANGVGVYDEIEALTGRDPSLPAVHVTLRRLEDKGLLESTVGSPSPRGGRPRRYYRPTSEGLAALRGFRRMWERLWTDMPLPDSEPRA